MGTLARIRRFRFYMLMIGGVFLVYGIYQKYWYSDVIREAVKTIEANRLDQQHLEEVGKRLMAPKDLISYNMGVRATRANNLKQASEHFYEVIRDGHDPLCKRLAYYNLGNILVQLDLPKKAAEMYRESLRLDPTAWDSKYNLERLYVFYPMAFPSDQEQASLNPEPGDKKGDKTQMGRRGTDEPDI